MFYVIEITNLYNIHTTFELISDLFHSTLAVTIMADLVYIFACSGHGISGTALLTGLSWLAVPVMFAGGIFSAFMMQFSGTNTYSDQWQPS